MKWGICAGADKVPTKSQKEIDKIIQKECKLVQVADLASPSMVSQEEGFRIQLHLLDLHIHCVDTESSIMPCVAPSCPDHFKSISSNTCRSQF